ncbi:MAG: polyprenyl synthetase family protein [Planctomycetes bacterium]|nr:polyprenyl synthetase family protein [Planctomycetota bacterium]
MSTESTSAIRRFGRQGRSSRFSSYKAVPPDPAERGRISHAAIAEAAALPVNGRPSRDALHASAQRLLENLGLDKAYLGFTMVMVANAYWAEALAGVAFSRRLLLLPECLGSIAPDGDGGLSLPAIRIRAEQLGYRVLVADGTPIVVKVLAERNVDGIVGVACLDSLEAVFEKIWQMGVPACAVPLLRDDCRDTATDLPVLAALLEWHNDSARLPSSSWLGLMQFTAELFEGPVLARLLALAEPKALGGALDATGGLARQWLCGGGKRFRPFITLAGACCTAGVSDPSELGDGVFRIAVAIEAFHKASLAHDDIEDEDSQRYGRPTLHRTHGPAVAINVGDYLLGLGYRLVATAGDEVGADTVAAILAELSHAHVRLAQGQGAELMWRRETLLSAVPPQQVLKAYALKTAPAFTVALGSGLLLGGESLSADRRELLGRFSRDLGVAFQLLNDLSDWAEDARAGRVTYLTALAAKAGGGDWAGGLLEAINSPGESEEALVALGRQLEGLGVFQQAEAMAERLHQRAGELAKALRPKAFADLCGFLVDLILT